MRLSLFLFALLISACASNINEVSTKGHDNNDWMTATHQLNAAEGHEQPAAAQCRNDQILWCSTTLGHTNCSCVLEQFAQDRVGGSIGHQRRGRFRQ